MGVSIGMYLSEDNYEFLNGIRKKTKKSISHQVNILVDAARKAAED